MYIHAYAYLIIYTTQTYIYICTSQHLTIIFIYGRDGAGILISRDVYDGIRQAQASDVRTIEDLLHPLEIDVSHHYE